MVMEYVALGIMLGIGLGFANAKKKRKRKQKQVDNRIETTDERKRREADELITVILPTINNDYK